MGYDEEDEEGGMALGGGPAAAAAAAGSSGRDIYRMRMRQRSKLTDSSGAG